MLFSKGKAVLYASILSRIQVHIGMILSGNETLATHYLAILKRKITLHSLR